MLNRIKDWLGEAGRPVGDRAEDEARIAAAALLFEAARMDSDVAPEETARITAMVRRHFGLSEEEAASLRGSADRESAEAVEWHRFAQTLNDRFSYEQRVEIVEMLWEVAYADGKLHDLEASLLRRIGGLLYVSDRDRGAARQRVLDRLGIVDPATDLPTTDQ